MESNNPKQKTDREETFYNREVNGRENHRYFRFKTKRSGYSDGFRNERKRRTTVDERRTEEVERGV